LTNNEDLILKDLFEISKAVFSGNNLFSSRDEQLEGLAQKCKVFLEYMGYTVKKPMSYELTINKQDDLIDFFYHLRDYFHPEYVMYRNPPEKDRKIAKAFIKNIKEATKSSNKIVLRQCANIIHTVFKYEEEFKFNIPIYFHIFGQDSMYWVTNKALMIIERENLNSDITKRDKMIEEYENKYEKEEDGIPFTDLDEVLSRL
jgi:hypothetical protein